MDKKIVIAPAGKNTKALFVGMRDFPASKIFLISSEDQLNESEKAKKELDKFSIPVNIVKIGKNKWESTFEEVSKIASKEKDAEILINTSSGDRNAQCAMTSAAFVNGLKAFSVNGNETMLLPILKFSYYKSLTDKKLEILEILYNDKSCCKSLEELSKKTKMSPPLISYHVNGTLKSEGLKSLGLIDIHEEGRTTGLAISTMGKLLMKGYVQS